MKSIQRTVVQDGKGNIVGIEETEIDVPVPVSVSPLQARRALREAGLMPAVNAALAVADEETQEAWEYAVEVKRDSALLAAMAARLFGENADQRLDELFVRAAEL